jgi:hypothetical protein
MKFSTIVSIIGAAAAVSAAAVPRPAGTNQDRHR